MVILTSDNPRTENPLSILDEVEVGVREALQQRSHVKYQKVADRREAIATAIRAAQPGDMVLIAGRGTKIIRLSGPRSFTSMIAKSLVMRSVS